MFVIQVQAEVAAKQEAARALAAQLGEVLAPAPFALVLTAERLELRKLDEPAFTVTYINTPP